MSTRYQLKVLGPIEFKDVIVELDDLMIKGVKACLSTSQMRLK